MVSFIWSKKKSKSRWAAAAGNRHGRLINKNYLRFN
jgi:hypothetical protein